MSDSATPYKIESYIPNPNFSESNKKILKKIFAHYKNEDAEKAHIIYFQEYFYHQNIYRIVIENEYFDAGYIEDYSHFYVKAYHDYQRKCKRLHFFSYNFKQETFKKAIAGDKKAIRKLQNSYKGFCVVKPLPDTFIGKTCLNSYEKNAGNYSRIFPLKREYTANLFGINLTVNTIAFQEQDSEVAMCATSALWSALQQTGKLFHHLIPSPVEITEFATKNNVYGNRIFPNQGLNDEQMCKAISEIGLDPEYFDKLDNSTLKQIVRAYMSAEIPIIFNIGLFDICTINKKYVKDKDSEALIYDIIDDDPDEENSGWHSVTITGFGLKKKTIKLSELKNKNTDIIYVSDLMNKLYVHDDQVGPFARMGFINKASDVPTIKNPSLKSDIITKDKYLTTSFAANSTVGVSGKFEYELTNIAYTYSCIIPLHKTIRIDFKIVKDLTYKINYLINTFLSKFNLNKNHIVWDIRLLNNNDYKEEITRCSVSEESNKLKILLKSYPRYLWVISGIMVSDEIFDKDIHYQEKVDILIDATDLRQGEIISDILFFGKNIAINVSLMKFFYERALHDSNIDYAYLNDKNIRFLLNKIENIEDLI